MKSHILSAFTAKLFKTSPNYHGETVLVNEGSNWVIEVSKVFISAAFISNSGLAGVALL